MPRDERAPALPVRQAIDEQDAEEALAFLFDTAERAAQLVALEEEAHDKVKRARAAALLGSSQSSQDRREAEALVSSAVERAIAKRTEIITERVKLQHLRRYHELRLELFRTFSANRRQERV